MPVRLTTAPAPQNEPTLERALEIVLHSGVRLVVRPGLVISELAELVTALERPRC